MAQGRGKRQRARATHTNRTLAKVTCSPEGAGASGVMARLQIQTAELVTQVGNTFVKVHHTRHKMGAFCSMKIIL